MARFLGLLSALGILVAIWAVLAGVGFVTGAIPPGRGSNGGGADELGDAGASAEAVADGGDGRADGGMAAADGGDPADAGTGATHAPEARALHGYAACGGGEGTAREPVLHAAHVTGDPRPELLLGCGPRFELLAIVTKETGEDGAVLQPTRIATFTAGVDEGVARLEAGRPAAGDVDGDGLPDLVLPYYALGDDGDTRGGHLYLLRRQSAGAFEAPRALAPIAAVDTVLADLDGREGLDVVSMNRTRVHSRLRSEAWVFGGGASPTRTASLRTGLGGVSVAVGDLDVDGHGDVVAVVGDGAEVDLFLGDGSGQFPRSIGVAVAGGRRAVGGDLDGDGRTDVLVQGEGIHLLRAGALEELEPAPIDAPTGLREIVVLDTDGDGKPDIVGIDGERLVCLRQTDPLVFAEESLLSLSDLSPERFAAADFDGDGALDLAVLGHPRGGADRWELVFVSDARGDARAGSPSGAPEIPDAPLSLRIPLP